MEITKKVRRDYDKEPRQRRDYAGKTAQTKGRSRTAALKGNGEDEPRGRRKAAPAGYRKDSPKEFSAEKKYGRPAGPRNGGKTGKPAAGRTAVGKPRQEADTEMRLNKFIANSGVCSRREADKLIQAGVVTVNGKVVTELGTKIDSRKDTVLFGGQKLRGEEKVYIVMNKPKGFVTTTSDPHAEQTVMDLLTKCPARVFPVGRLDKNTTGVLMFTNDGEMAEKLTHPSFNKKKIYEVTLDRKLAQEDFDRILSGITLEDGPIKADELDFVDAEDKRKVGIEIHSGRNRIVRRIFEALGYQVKGLDRVYFAGLTKKGIKRGAWRYLSEGEVNILKMGAFN